KFNMNVKNDLNPNPSIIRQIPSNFVPVKATLKLKNKDTVGGNSIEIDGVIAAVLRVGEGVRHGGTLKLPLGGELSTAWSAAANTTPKGVLPVPEAPAGQ